MQEKQPYFTNSKVSNSSCNWDRSNNFGVILLLLIVFLFITPFKSPILFFFLIIFLLSGKNNKKHYTRLNNQANTQFNVPEQTQQTYEHIFCSDCGTKLDYDAKFCSDCGKRI